MICVCRGQVKICSNCKMVTHGSDFCRVKCDRHNGVTLGREEEMVPAAATMEAHIRGDGDSDVLCGDPFWKMSIGFNVNFAPGSPLPFERCSRCLAVKEGRAVATNQRPTEEKAPEFEARGTPVEIEGGPQVVRA